MRIQIKTWLLVAGIAMSFHGQSQILISLIFGDKLNSDGIEFGLDGGLAMTNIRGSEDGFRNRYALNLGMYFDIRLSDPWYLHTGFIVKSPGGMTQVESYSTGIAEIDNQLDKAKVSRRLRYIHLPLFLRYRLPHWTFIEAGPQVGFRTRAIDQFEIESGDNTLEYKRNIADNYNRWDAGFTVGAGVKLYNGKGITLGARYYFGLTDICKDDGMQNNRIGYFFASIPIGREKE